jgi:hypothetical protein
MKRIIFVFISGLFIFTACEKVKIYTKEQLDALDKLSGNYHANIDNKMIYAVISFTAHYSKPTAVNNDKNKFLYDVHGECYFSDYQYYILDKGTITCYFSFSKKADSMSFYYKGGNNHKDFLRTYKLRIENEDVFHLDDNGRVLTFEKVK